MKKPILTPKQEAFCRNVLECQTFSEAYRRAYNASRLSDKSVHKLASALIAEPKIAARMADLRAKAADKACLTLVDHLASLAELRDAAAEAGQFPAAITAEVSRGKACGFYTERIKKELTGRDGEPVASRIEVRFVGSVADED